MTITDIDFMILQHVREALTGGVLDAPMLWISRTGNLGAVWFLLALVLVLFRRTRPVGIVVFMSLFLVEVCGSRLLKPLIARPRPCQIDTLATLLVHCPRSFSCPSGHATLSFAAAGALWLLHFPGRGIALLLAAVMAFTRIYLYVHFPSDVLAGCLLGFFCAWLSVLFARHPPEWFRRLCGPDTTYAPWQH